MADKYNTTENSEYDTTGAKNVKRCKRKAPHKLMIVAGLAAIVGAAAFVGAAQSSGWGNQGSGQGYGQGYGHGHGHGYSQGGPGYMMDRFDEFDVNNDGKLTRAEMNAAHMSRFKGADSNKDAALSLDEFQGLWMERMRPRMVDRFQMMDDDGDGRVTEQEFAMPYGKIMRYMDRNDDGVLDMKEMTPMHRGWYDDRDDDKRDDDKD